MHLHFALHVPPPRRVVISLLSLFRAASTACDCQQRLLLASHDVRYLIINLTFQPFAAPTKRIVGADLPRGQLASYCAILFHEPLTRPTGFELSFKPAVEVVRSRCVEHRS